MALHRATPAELKERLEAERSGITFLLLQDGEGRQRLLPLDEARGVFTIGRTGASDLTLDWDAKVSRAHAELQSKAGEWALTDDGLSRNGTFLNGERVTGLRRLSDGDVLRFGDTSVTFHRPGGADHTETSLADDQPQTASLSDAQRRVLVALCRPYREGAFATPATNKQIAEELFLSVDAVKTHLRAISTKLGIDDLPQNTKRAALVERALQTGLVSLRELQ